MQAHSIFFYLLLLVMGAGVLHSLGAGSLFFFKSSGVKRSNNFYGLLMISSGLTLLHNIFVITGFYTSYPQWHFLPVYYTLALPVLLFYYIKLSLYPAYRLRLTDVKHFILPVGQLIFFVVLFFMPLEFKSRIDRQFWNPFYGAMEQFLYLTTFFAYLYFAYRYIRQKRLSILHRGNEERQVLYLHILVQILFVLFVIHTAFVVTDFVAYTFLNINMRDSRVYAALGALSFTALVYWLGLYGFQVLFWGRRVFGRKKSG